MRQSNVETSGSTHDSVDACTDLIERGVMWELATSIEDHVNQPLAAITMDAQTCLRFLDEGRTDDGLSECLT